ncbi:hypothetical protein C6988_08590, partial [Nitrosopumilus sp. b1]|uniref:cache domain-containing protein n=1 Tax=Nitrosopumilus sp. b1 TaxID=2109907 RepID=UPI0015F485BC
MKIRNKIMIASLTVAFPIIGVGGYLDYILTAEKLEEDVLEQLNSIASIQKQRVIESIENNFDKLNGVTSRTQLRESLEQFNLDQNTQDKLKIEKIILDAKSSIDDIEEVFILNSSGDVIFSTSAKFENKSFEGTEIFEKGYAKNHLSLSISDETPVLMISGPLLLNDKHLGVAVIKTPTQTLSKITSDYTSLGKSGESFMAKRDSNGDALFITSLRFDDDSFLKRTIPKERTDVPITQALLKNESIFKEKVDYRGVPVLSATKYIEQMDWGLAVKIDRSEAFATLEYIG